MEIYLYCIHSIVSHQILIILQQITAQDELNNTRSLITTRDRYRFINILARLRSLRSFFSSQNHDPFNPIQTNNVQSNIQVTITNIS